MFMHIYTGTHAHIQTYIHVQTDIHSRARVVLVINVVKCIDLLMYILGIYVLKMLYRRKLSKSFFYSNSYSFTSYPIAFTTTMFLV